MSAAQFVGRTLWRDSRTESLAVGQRPAWVTAGQLMSGDSVPHFGIQALYLTNAHPSRKNGRAK